MDENRIYKECIQRWGEEAQFIQAIEELSELIKEITKLWRDNNSDSTLKVQEEIADVQIMISEISIIVDQTDNIQRIKKAKLRRLEHKLKTNEWKPWQHFLFLNDKKEE